MEEQEISKTSRQTLIPWRALSLDLILFSSLLLGVSIMGAQGFKEKLTVLFEDPAFSGTLLLITAVFISMKKSRRISPPREPVASQSVPR